MIIRALRRPAASDQLRPVLRQPSGCMLLTYGNIAYIALLQPHCRHVEGVAGEG